MPWDGNVNDSCPPASPRWRRRSGTSKKEGFGVDIERLRCWRFGKKVWNFLKYGRRSAIEAADLH
jgi:hypothetical protein